MKTPAFNPQGTIQYFGFGFQRNSAKYENDNEDRNGMPVNVDQADTLVGVGGYEFQFGPFWYSSELDIPELRGVGGSGRIAVRIELGATPEELTGGRQFGALCWVLPDEYVLNIPDVARFQVSGGSRVRVELYPNAPAADVSSYLLGSVFGALCHQNGLLPLHASSVAAGGGVTAFLGESGAGKSTLAATLQTRGHRIVSDDICVLEDDGEGGWQVVPVAGWLKLWRQSLEHLGETPDDRNKVFLGEDKYRVYLEQEPSERLKLERIVFLQRAESAGDAPRLEGLSASETIARMMEMTYLAYIPELNGKQAEQFRRCARALDGAKAFRLWVPWGLDRLDEVVELMERDLVG